MRRIAAPVLSMLILGMTLAACGGGGGGGGGATGGGGTGGTPTGPGSLIYFTEYYPELKATVSYPAIWRREIIGFDPNIIAAYFEPATSGSDTFEENVALVTVQGSNLRDSSGITGIQIVSSRAITIDGLPGQEVIFDGTVPGVSGGFRFMEIYYTQGDNAFGLFYSAASDQFDRNREIVRYMAGQLEVGKIVFDGLFLGSDLETPGNSPIASDGNNFLVVSCRESADFPYPAELIGRIIGPDRSLVGNEITIQSEVDTGNTGCTYTRPRITFDGSNFLVTYMTSLNDRRRIVAKRISPAGQLLDSAPIDISMNAVNAAFEPAVAFTGTRHLVVWHEDISNDINDVVRAAFVDPDGTVSASFTVFDELRTLYPDQFGNFLSRPEIAVGNNRALVTLSPWFARDVRQPARRAAGARRRGRQSPLHAGGLRRAVVLRDVDRGTARDQHDQQRRLRHLRSRDFRRGATRQRRCEHPRPHDCRGSIGSTPGRPEPDLRRRPLLPAVEPHEFCVRSRHLRHRDRSRHVCRATRTGNLGDGVDELQQLLPAPVPPCPCARTHAEARRVAGA